ncbi:MAG: DUF3305 domain-containing protein [Betaproteobacteria bacterium]|nr:DUF3305 domain-containing protein [Betaproteobacteria bacterium]
MSPARPTLAGNAVSEHTYPIAVIMERTALANPWLPEQWEAKGVVRDIFPPGTPERVIVHDENQMQVLFPGFTLKLHRHEAEGYYLNVSSPRPKVFVLWRMQDSLARPCLVTVSYNEGARWTDSGENVDGVPLPPELLPWIGEFVEQNYKPEPKAKKRYASSRDKGVGFHG